MSDLEGRLIARKYRVKRRLGSGGVADVYEAYHEDIGQRFAVKVLRSEFAAYPEVSERFLTEARAASAVPHPGVVKVFDYGRLENGEPFLVMEYLEGESLIDLVRRRGKLAADKAVGVCIHILDALDAAHRVGVIHRDLKPENVVLVRGPSGEPWAKLIDFGIARLRADSPGALRQTVQGTVMGTAYYMSPEQARGVRDVDGRADIYAVGVMLFEMVTGKLPFEGKTTSEIMTNALSQPFPSVRAIEPSVSAALEEVIFRATSRKRDERYQTARDFGKALQPLRPELVAVQLLDDEEADGLLSPGNAEADQETTGIRRLDELAGRLPTWRASLGTPPRISPPPIRRPGLSMATPAGVQPAVRRSLTPPPIRRSQPPVDSTRNTVVVSRWVVFVGATLGIGAVAAGFGALLVVLSARSEGGGDAGAEALAAAVASESSEPGRLHAVADQAAASAAVRPAMTPRIEAVPVAAVEPVALAPRPAAPVEEPAPVVVATDTERVPIPSADATIRLLDLPAGAEVTLDGDPVGDEFTLEVSDAPHTLRVTLRGRRPFVREFRAEGDLQIRVVFPRERGGAEREVPSAAASSEPAAGSGEAATPRPLANPFGDG